MLYKNATSSAISVIWNPYITTDHKQGEDAGLSNTHERTRSLINVHVHTVHVDISQISQQQNRKLNSWIVDIPF